MGDRLVAMVYMWSGTGIVTCDYGKFESRNEMTVERFNSQQGQVVGIFEFEFIPSEKMKMVWKRWEEEESREDAEISEFIWTQVTQ